MRAMWSWGTWVRHWEGLSALLGGLGVHCREGVTLQVCSAVQDEYDRHNSREMCAQFPALAKSIILRPYRWMHLIYWGPLSWINRPSSTGLHPCSITSERQDPGTIIQAGLIGKEAGYSVLFCQAPSVAGVMALLLHHHFHQWMAALVCRGLHGLKRWAPRMVPFIEIKIISLILRCEVFPNNYMDLKGQD